MVILGSSIALCLESSEEDFFKESTGIYSKRSLIDNDLSKVDVTVTSVLLCVFSYYKSEKYNRTNLMTFCLFLSLFKQKYPNVLANGIVSIKSVW